jgi:hypothetical protein
MVSGIIMATVITTHMPTASPGGRQDHQPVARLTPHMPAISFKVASPPDIGVEPGPMEPCEESESRRSATQQAADTANTHHSGRRSALWRMRCPVDLRGVTTGAVSTSPTGRRW